MVSSIFLTYEGKVILSDFAVKDFLYEIRRSICDPVVDRIAALISRAMDGAAMKP